MTLIKMLSGKYIIWNKNISRDRVLKVKCWVIHMDQERGVNLENQHWFSASIAPPTPLTMGDQQTLPCLRVISFSLVPYGIQLPTLTSCFMRYHRRGGL